VTPSYPALVPDVELRAVAANRAPGPERCYCCDETAWHCAKRRACVGCKQPTFPFETSTPGYCPRCVSTPGTYALVDVGDIDIDGA